MSDLVFKLEDSKLSIDVYHLLHSLPEEKHLNLAESLSCSDTVINFVMDQVLEGLTENGFSGSWSSNYDSPLQKYRQRIAEQSTEVAKKEIEELKRRLTNEQKLKNEYMDKYFDLYHKDLASNT